ncbi:MAG: hypothetical protein MK089_11955, partial [Phycisphaerales bacterium]|nr:hypothetical protein [Phycisphaerales bacterium]
MTGRIWIAVAVSLLSVLVLANLAVAKDIIHTSDGRVLHGEIVGETERQIIFRYEDPALGIKTNIRLPKSAIEKIERNVQPAPTEQEEAASGTPADAGSDAPATSAVETNSSDSSAATKFYVVPFKGQVGTDITARIYEDIIEDIKEKRPDVVILELSSSDIEDVFSEGAVDIIEGEYKPQERNDWDKKNMQGIRLMFNDDLPRDIDQVIWVKDAVGSSSVLAMAWPDMYMSPEAKLGGMDAYVRMYRNAAGDAHVAAKFGDAAFGWLKGITDYGIDPDDPNESRDKLIEAMAKPEKKLSVSWMGRKPWWRATTNGDKVIDPSDKAAAMLEAWQCEDFCLSDGTAETLDDLAVLLGERQYQLVEGIAAELVQKHHDEWRAAWEKAVKAYADFQMWMGRVNGPNALGNLRKAESSLRRL